MRFSVSIAIIFLLSACTHFKDPILGPIRANGGHVNPAGPNQLFHEVSFEQLHLSKIIDPYSANDKEKDIDKIIGVDIALKKFYQRKNVDLADERNRIQQRVLGISEQRCSTYKFYLKRLETSQSIYTGIAATLFGGLGAMFRSVDAARIFSGAAGIASGTSAELKQSYFSNAASSIIIPGINLTRSEIHRKIRQKRMADIKNYTLEEALMDASTFHDACSINAGLERAGEAVNQIANPGIQALNDTLFKLRHSNQLVKEVNKEINIQSGHALQMEYFEYGDLLEGGLPANRSYLEVALENLNKRYKRNLSVANDVNELSEAYEKQCLPQSNLDNKTLCDQLKNFHDDPNKIIKSIEDNAKRIIEEFDGNQFLNIGKMDVARVMDKSGAVESNQLIQKKMLVVELYINEIAKEWDNYLNQLDGALTAKDYQRLSVLQTEASSIKLGSELMPFFMVAP